MLADLALALPAARSAETATLLTTEFTYTATLPAQPFAHGTIRMWLPLPSDGAWQRVRDLHVDAPGPSRITSEKEYGNRIVYLETPVTNGPMKVVVRFTVDRAISEPLPGSPGTGVNIKRSLLADRNVPLGGRFGEIAAELTRPGQTVAQKARSLFDHVVATMQYDYKKDSPKLGEGDVAFVCDYKKGNCSDLHSYLISLARSLKIPAYLEFGFPISGIPLAEPQPREGAITGYHCWTWFHDPALGWRPLDASDGRRWLDANRPELRDKVFGELVPERSAVAFSRGRDITLEPAQNGPPLNYFIYPYAEVDGAPVKPTWEVRYKLGR